MLFLRNRPLHRSRKRHRRLRVALRTGLCLVCALIALTLVRPVQSDSPPPADDLGTFLGRTVACNCVSGDQSIVLAIYRDFLDSAYGETYAVQASGHMRLALREAYDNQITICRYTCGRDLIVDLQDMIDRRMPYADIYAGSASEWEPDHTSGYHDLEDVNKKSDLSFCRSQPSRPECRDF